MTKKNVISFMNMKGGVAKSTLCANLAYTLAKDPQFNYKILLIDMDPQFNLTSILIDEKEYFNTIYGKKDISCIFEVKKPSAKEEIVIDKSNLIKEITENLHIIPGSFDLIAINNGEDTLYNLRSFIEDNHLRDEYDFIFIDCPPTKGHYLKIAFYATDYYITPVKPDYLSTIGIELFNQTIEKLNNSLHKIYNLGIIFTLVGGSAHHQQIMEKIKEDYEYSVFSNKLRHSYKIPEFIEEKVLLYDFTVENLRKLKGDSNLTTHRNDIINLSEEFIKKVKERI